MLWFPDVLAATLTFNQELDVCNIIPLLILSLVSLPVNAHDAIFLTQVPTIVKCHFS